MATAISSLWLPIIVSGVALFFASWIAWMLLPHHKSEFRRVPDEVALSQLIRDTHIEPGQYMAPHCPTPEEWKSEAFQSRLKSGPNYALYLWKPGGGMGTQMFCTWLLFTVLSFVIAYLAGMVIAPGAERWFIFRLVATAGVLTYANANLLNAIWFRRKVLGDILDGVAYALITGAIFAFLWPSSSS